MSRLTRKDMKRDEVLEGAARLVHLMREHGRKLAVGLGLVVVLALAAAVWFALQQRAETRANEALARALEIYRAEIDVLSPQPDRPASPTFATESARREAAQAAFEEVRERYGSFKVATVAAGYLADLAAREGDLERARELWLEASSSLDTALDVELWLNRLASDRAADRSEQVLAELQAMLGDGGSPVPAVVVLDQIAETLLTLDRRAEARDVYQRIVDEHPGSAYSASAVQALSTL